MKSILNTVIAILVISNFYIWSDLATKQDGDGKLEITVLNVGQGDSILIKTPNNHYGLIDGGKDSKVMKELAETLPYFVKKFDFVVFTHPDSDHIAGLSYVLDKFEIGTVFIEKIKKDSSIYSEVKSKIGKYNIKNFELKSNNDFTLDKVNFDVVWPGKNIDVYNFPESNDTSIGLVISYKNFTFYTAGDLASKYEYESVKNKVYSQIDVLKVGHHGSKTSSSVEFLKLIDPKASIISSGKGNSYGHPAPQILKNLDLVKTSIYRTDLQGRIEINTNGSNFLISCQFCNNKEFSAL